MKLATTPGCDLSDETLKAKTKKTLRQWFDLLDQQGGLEAGRRELTQWLYAELNKDEYWAVTIVVEYEKARGQKEKDGLPKGYSICSTKTIAAPLERVFQAWSQAKELDEWLGPKTKLDWREGGSLTNADGNRWTLGRIRAQKDLRFFWEQADCAPGSAVEVLFSAKPNDKVGITLNHSRIPERAAADQLRQAWAAALDRLKSMLES